jgi:putative ABC transport system substrate-binding protein
LIRLAVASLQAWRIPAATRPAFSPLEFGFSGKWLELLKEIAPTVKRIGVMRDPAIPSQIGMFAFARTPDGGLLVAPDFMLTNHRNLIIGLAAEHRLPAVYADRTFVTDGGLMCDTTDRIDQFRQAAAYVDRILRGDKPADLPVQARTRYETVVNLKAAKALGLTVPSGLLVAADEVIE